MEVSARALNRATLERQLLLARADLDVPDAVRQVVALQAQEPASPYLALWNRVAGFDAAELDAAFGNATVVKASLMRVTLHAVHGDDYAPLHAAMAQRLRDSRVLDSRFAAAGHHPDDLDALSPHLARFTRQPRLGVEIEQHLADAYGADATWLWWALKTLGPLHHAVTDAPWSFGPRPYYRAAPRPRQGVDADAAVQHLVRRYLAGFGPASLLDLTQFTRLPRPVLRAAISALGDGTVRLTGPDGATLHDLSDRRLPDEDAPAPPRLLPMWDSVLLAYADRSRITPPEYRREIIRTNGDTLPTVLVDGRVAGVWRAVDEGIEVTAFERLPADAWDALAAEAAALIAFLAPRDPAVYRRYRRWWARLPADRVRILGT